MKIFIAADHRGFELKKILHGWLIQNGYEVTDLGAFEYSENDDYVDFASAAGEAISHDPNSRGIVICGSGIGVDIVANKFPNVRCGLGFGVDQIRDGRSDDDINILAISSDYTYEDEAKDYVTNFLNTPFNPTENHSRRIEKIKVLS